MAHYTRKQQPPIGEGKMGRIGVDEVGVWQMWEIQRWVEVSGNLGDTGDTGGRGLGGNV